MPSEGPSRWEKGTRRVIASTRVFDVLGIGYRHSGRARESEFFVIAPPDWVNVLAVTPDRHLVLVRQFRFGIDQFSLEIPGGVMEAGEDPVAAAVRELREETGYEGTGARILGSVHPNPAIQDNRCHIVLVEEARLTAPLDWDEDEEIEVTTAPVAEVLKWAREGKITHSLVLSALLLLG